MPSVPAPQELPAALRPLFDLVADLARRTGYCFARTVWLARRLGVSRQHVCRLVNKIAGFGRFRVERVPGSHERRIYPVFLGRRGFQTGSEQVTKSRRTFRETEPATQETDKQPEAEAVPDGPEVVALVEEKVKESAARRLVKMFGPEKCRRALAAAKAKRAAGKVSHVPGWVVSCLEGGWDLASPANAPGRPLAAPETACADADRHDREREKASRCGHVPRELWPELERRARAKLEEKRIYPGAVKVAQYMAFAYEADLRDGKAVRR